MRGRWCMCAPCNIDSLKQNNDIRGYPILFNVRTPNRSSTLHRTNERISGQILQCSQRVSFGLMEIDGAHSQPKQPGPTTNYRIPAPAPTSSETQTGRRKRKSGNQRRAEKVWDELDKDLARSQKAQKVAEDIVEAINETIEKQE